MSDPRCGADHPLPATGRSLRGVDDPLPGMVRSLRGVDDPFPLAVRSFMGAIGSLRCAEGQYRGLNRLLAMPEALMSAFATPMGVPALAVVAATKKNSERALNS